MAPRNTLLEASKYPFLAVFLRLNYLTAFTNIAYQNSPHAHFEVKAETWNLF